MAIGSEGGGVSTVDGEERRRGVGVKRWALGTGHWALGRIPSFDSLSVVSRVFKGVRMNPAKNARVIN